MKTDNRRFPARWMLLISLLLLGAALVYGLIMDQWPGVATSRLLRQIYGPWRGVTLCLGALFALAALAGFFIRQRKARKNPQPGAAETLLSYRFLKWAAVLLLTVTFSGIGGWLVHLGNIRAEVTMQHEAQRLKTAYEVGQIELEHQLTVLAREIAADDEVIRLLTLAGGASPAQFRSLHDQLHRYLTPRWHSLQQVVDIRQMQIVLPGTVSFLRMHLPEEYGDSLKGVRHLLDEVERTNLPHSGFETGRAFSGLRGAAPILQRSSDGAQRYLGAIEIGIQFDGHISRIGRRTGVGYGVLLKPKQANAIMWESLQPTNIKQNDKSCCLLLTASRGELADWVAESRLPPYHDNMASGFIEEHGKTFQVIRFPLEEFLSKLGAASPIGSVVIWREITELVEANRKYQRQVALYVAFAYVSALSLLVLLLRASQREWQRQLSARAAEIAHLAHQKEVLLEALGEGVYGVNLHGKATFLNTAAQRMLGFTAEQVIGQDQHALFHHHRPDGAEYPAGQCPIHETLTDGIFRSREEWFIRSNGEGFPVRVTVAAVSENGRRSGAVVVFRDITDQRNKEEELIRLATTDALTGVVNRRCFTDQLNQEIRRFQRTGEPAALMMLDLDLFKLVNDTYGHAAGDQVLQRFASLAHRTLRQVDVIGRLGGEEFAVLLPGSDTAAALEAGERLRKALEAETISIEAAGIRITTSIGVTILQAGDEKSDQPLSRADQALYAAKYMGRNRVEYRGEKDEKGMEPKFFG